MRLLSSVSFSAMAVGLSLAPLAPAAAQDSAPAVAQAETQPAAPLTEDEDTIVVLGARLIGELAAAQPPVLVLNPQDIAAYGAGSIAELLQALGPQVSSARGRGGGFPVVLVNGVRIGSFRELRSYPPEAIEKFEVFPEEVALQYGYSADQRVVNVILKDNYSSQELEVEYGQPFDGGYSTQEAEATYLRIDGDARLNLNLGWNNSSALTEAERGVIQSGGVPDLATDPDPAAYRTLVADGAGFEGTLNWSTKVGQQHSLSLNATFERDDSLRLQGLDTVLLTNASGASALRSFNASNPLAVDTGSQTYAGGATLNLHLGDWEVTNTLDASRALSNSQIDRRVDTGALVAAAAAGTLAIDAPLGTFADAGSDTARTTTTRASGLSTLRGSPFYLPAGDVNLTLDAGYNWNRIASQDTRNPGLPTLLKRGNLTAGANLTVPLTSRRDDFLSAVGDLTLNANAGVDHLSDFGTLYDWNVGLTWGVTEALTLTATYVNRDAAPSLAQLGNPEVATLNVPVFDLTNNETVLVTVISGGNPLLPAQNQSDWKLGAQWELPFLDGATLSVDYLRNSSSDVASAFPVLSPEIEAAFPGRITRDAAGTLVQIDQRAVSYAQRDEERLQFGLNLSGQIGASQQAGGGGGGGRGGPAAGGPAGGAVGGAGGGFGGGPGAGGGAGGGGGFRPDPEAFARMRATFCEAEPGVLRVQLNRAIAAAAAGEPAPVGENGQPLTLPPQMLQRLAGEDGVIDEAEFASLRDRFCNAAAPGAAQGGAPGGAAPGGTVAGGPPGGPPGGLGAVIFGGGGRPPGGPPPGGPPPGGFGRGPGGFGGGPGGGQGGRWFVNLQYNWELQNQVLIAPGLPLLDLLDGDALTGGGQAEHSGSLRVGTFYKGFGLIWNGTYTGSSTIDGTGLPGSTDLRFNDYATINVRAFADLGQQASVVAAVPFLAGSRIGIGVDNLFDTRQRVTDSAGLVPLRYQPFLIDPVGRSFEIEFRKLF